MSNFNVFIQIYHQLKSYLAFFLLVVFISACHSSTNEPLETVQNDFVFSPHKIWAHRVNSLEKLEKTHEIFEGMEIDLIYSESINNLYVAHSDADTLKNILLEDWIKHIPNPEKNWYWFDMKNLTKKNAEQIGTLFVNILNQYGIFNKVICEGRSVKALLPLKNKGLAVSYWIKSDIVFRKIFGDAIWKRSIERDIKKLKPNALSSFDWMHPVLDTSFPNENILYWLTSAEDAPENLEYAKKLCNLPNVKVVLVDYEEPIAY